MTYIHKLEFAPARAAILAGGRATRLGRPKATAPLAGRPLISYPLLAATEAGLDTVVVAKRDSELPELDVPVLIEPDQPRHPLCGVLEAFRASSTPVLALGCDMPFLNGELLAWLASLPEPLVVAKTGRGLHPLLARYGPALAGPLEAGLRRRAPLQELVDSLNPRVLRQAELRRFGDPLRLCFNVNTPQDLAEAERLLEVPGPPRRASAGGRT
jgi:molybdenum cofactor guanylyltransferase